MSTRVGWVVFTGLLGWYGMGVFGAVCYTWDFTC